MRSQHIVGKVLIETETMKLVPEQWRILASLAQAGASGQKLPLDEQTQALIDNRLVQNANLIDPDQIADGALVITGKGAALLRRVSPELPGVVLRNALNLNEDQNHWLDTIILAEGIKE